MYIKKFNLKSVTSNMFILKVMGYAMHSSIPNKQVSMCLAIKEKHVALWTDLHVLLHVLLPVRTCNSSTDSPPTLSKSSRTDDERHLLTQMCVAECTCDHGKCADGLEGTGRCVCYKGWKGASCSVGKMLDPNMDWEWKQSYRNP